MPKSKNRKNHAQKVKHQRMLDKHRTEKIRKENEKKYKEFEQMLANHRASVAERRLEHAKSLAESAEPTESELLAKSLTEAVLVEQQD